MGSPESELGRFGNETLHHVLITQGYWIADTPLTQAVWVEVMGQNPSQFKHQDRPVEQVSWDEVQSFIKILGEHIPGLDPRLPTEAEWERACRAGTHTATYAGDLETSWGDDPVLDPIAWYSKNSHRSTQLVGSKRPNAYGLYDTLGNLWEWCADRYAPYTGDAVNPVGPEEGAKRVIRGGSWLPHARNARAAYRSWLLPGFRYDDLGFRLARGPAPGAEPRVQPAEQIHLMGGARRGAVGSGAGAERRWRSQPP